MARFNNTMFINEISFAHSIQCVCAIGKSLCTYDIVVEMVPTKVIPDYLEVQDFIDNEVHMHFLTMEDATSAIANYLDRNYQPASGFVSCFCEDAKHFPVRVTKKIGGNI